MRVESVPGTGRGAADMHRLRFSQLFGEAFQNDLRQDRLNAATTRESRARLKLSLLGPSLASLDLRS